MDTVIVLTYGDILSFVINCLLIDIGFLVILFLLMITQYHYNDNLFKIGIPIKVCIYLLLHPFYLLASIVGTIRLIRMLSYLKNINNDLYLELIVVVNKSNRGVISHYDFHNMYLDIVKRSQSISA